MSEAIIRPDRNKEKKRVFLFLQGPSSPLFAAIAARLEATGTKCLRINLNLGDWIFWRRQNGYNYRGRQENFQAYIEQFLSAHGVTDIILLGEERPYHKVATIAAKKRGISVYVVEMGYLRPDWVTFERDGMSSNSNFPRDPTEILSRAARFPEPDWSQKYNQTFFADASYDLLYNLPNVFFWLFYPFYKRHGLFHPLHEYYGWIFRLLKSRSRTLHAERVVGAILRASDPFYVYPLQLQTDYQLRAHSDFKGQEQAIEGIIHSFMRYAPSAAGLVVKIHPLDNGLIRWEKVVSDIVASLGEDQRRVTVIDGGRLEDLYPLCSGVVTVNSTAALPAIRMRKPVKVCGRAIYDVDGLTFQGSLDEFWTASFIPDDALQKAFFKLLASQYQVRGNFYSREGAEAAAQAIADRLTNEFIVS